MKTKDKLHETRESLWRLIVSPSVWGAHFMLSYITAAIWCEKYAARTGTIEPVRWAITGYTIVALAVIAWNGWDGWKRHRHGRGELPHDEDTPEDRHRFMGFSTFLLAGLSGIATIFAALVVVFVEDCR